MGAQFLNQPQGEGLTSDPHEQFDFSGLSMLAQSARQASQIARERKMLRDLMRMSGQEVAEPAPEKGIMGGLKRVFGVGEEYQPISELETMQAQAGIKKMFEPSMAETVELERQKAAAGRRPIEEELSLEEAKAGIKTKAAKEDSTLKAIEHYKELANKEGWDLNLEPTLSPVKQLRAARTLYATKMGEKPEKEKLPSWAQEQKVSSIKAGLRRGEVTIGREFGEPSTYSIKSLADAYKAISDAGLDPAQFKNELAFYKDIVQTGKSPDGRTVAKMKDGKTFYLDTREEITE